MWIADIAVAIGPVIGYISQLQLIKQNKSVGSFSIDICAILMISAILRIYFWLESGFAVNLLFQAMFIIIVQVQRILVRQCCSMKSCNCLPGQKIKESHNLFGDGILLTNMVPIL